MKEWTDAIPWAIALASLSFLVYQYVRGLTRKKDEEKVKLDIFGDRPLPGHSATR